MIINPLHLVQRFFKSLFPKRLSSEDIEWVKARLTDNELRLFLEMPRTDRSHSYYVARAADEKLAPLELSPDLHQAACAAALMHDVGKTASGLGTVGRVIATMSKFIGGEEMGPAWQTRSGFTRKVGLYVCYGEVGSDMLALAGSHDWVIEWSREHHEAPDSWTVPQEVGEILVASDT